MRFFATVNQLFGGSWQLSAVLDDLSWLSGGAAVVGSWEEQHI